MPLYSTKPGYRGPDVMGHGRMIKALRKQPETYAPPKAWKEVNDKIKAAAAIKFLNAIKSHLVHTFVNEDGTVKVKGCFVSSLISGLRFDGWKNIPNIVTFQDGCEAMGFLVIHGTGNEWSNKPQYHGPWFERKDWLKNGQKAIGKYQAFIAMVDEKGEGE